MALKQVPLEVLPADRVQSTYRQLSIAATSLNTASDNLGKAIAVFDAALKKLNLGVSAWVNVSQGYDENDGDWWNRGIGYAKIGDTWGIALRTQNGSSNCPDRDTEERWLFNDGPRWMRVESIAKIPDLLEALLKQAEDTTSKIKTKTEELLALAAAMSKVQDDPQPEQKK